MYATTRTMRQSASTLHANWWICAGRRWATPFRPSFPQLKIVATAFLDSLKELRRHSVDMCYGFISQGEANPGIVTLLRGSEHTAHLQALLTSVFVAIAQGRSQPTRLPPSAPGGLRQACGRPIQTRLDGGRHEAVLR